MKIEELTNFMNRIKNYYQEFSVDKGKIKEWYEQLKIYDIEDLDAKLNNHIKSEYGDKPPMMNYLLKGLIPSADKGVVKKYIVECPMCHDGVRLEDFDNHYSRCSAVNYIYIKTEKVFGTKIDKQQLYRMNKMDFDKLYDRLLNKLVDKTEGIELRTILKLIYPNQDSEVIDDMIKSIAN